MTDLLILMNVINAMAKGHAFDQQQIQARDAKIAELEKRISELEARPVA